MYGNNNQGIKRYNAAAGNAAIKRKKAEGPSSAAEKAALSAEVLERANSVRGKRLMKEFIEIKKAQEIDTDPTFTVELIDDNLFEWNVYLRKVDKDSPLAADMSNLKIPHILLHLKFPESFPFGPPFMRVVEPRIDGGFVMHGGAICMELLTPGGWASTYTIEGVIIQFAASLVKGNGRISKVPKHSTEYSLQTAMNTFKVLVKTHDNYGWFTPKKNDG